MPLPSALFSSMLSSVLRIFCQSTKHIFSPIRVNRKLPASGFFLCLGTQTAALVPKVGPVPGVAKGPASSQGAKRNSSTSQKHS